jgi:hypothetical protein
MNAPHKVLLPARNLVTALKQALDKYGVPEASFAEVVTQCLDVYMDWNGEEEQIALLPYFNRIEVPALRTDDFQNVYDSVQHAVHTFAREIYLLLMRHGFFPRTHARPNMNYAFEQFVVGGDIVLFHFNF